MIMHPVPYAAIFFDADGTLRQCTIDQQPCPNKPGEWELLPNVKETLALYDWDHHGMSIVSNQGGIALGFLTEAMAYQLLADLVMKAFARFPPMGSLLLCPHAVDAGCVCRKPSPELLHKAETFWHSRGLLHGPADCVYIGDMESDRQAAEAAKIDFIWAGDFFGWETQ